MKRSWMPSPAILVAVLALVAALAGTALAGSDASTSAINKKKVKKIADKEITKLAPGLSVANAANSAALEGQPASAFASSASEAYREVGTPGQPQFQNGWHNDTVGGVAAAFYKDPLGVVHLKGSVSNVATGQSTIFILPPGYRQSEGALFFGFATGDTYGVFVQANGEVNAACIGGGCHPSLDGITFRAD